MSKVKPPPISQSLGAIIVQYSTYRRGWLAAQFLLTGFGAAGIWRLMKLIEPSIFVPLLAFVAVPLSLYCLSVFFRLLSPGRTVAVRERGLVVGKKAFLWEEIEKVTYRLDVGSSADTTDRRSHQFEFHLAAKDRVEFLSLDEDALPSHVDVQEFISHLQERVREVDFLDEPKVRKEQVQKREIRRYPELHDGLRSEAENALRQASREGISLRVSDALKKGERRRKDLARAHWWSSLTAGIRSVAYTLAAIMLVFVGFYSGFALLFQLAADIGFASFDLFDLFDIPAGALRYSILGTLVVVAWWSTGHLETLARRNRRSVRQHVAVTNILKPRDGTSQAEAFLSMARAGEAFAVYLRSFSGEYFQYLEKPLVGGSEYRLPVEYEVVERDFDLALATAVEGLIPTFALANVSDASVSRKLQILCVPDEEWFIVACELISAADVVLVHLAAVTESLLAELTVLDRQSLHEKTLLIWGKEFDSRELPEAEKELVSRFPNRVAEADHGWQKELRNFFLSRSQMRGS